MCNLIIGCVVLARLLKDSLGHPLWLFLPGNSACWKSFACHHQLARLPPPSHFCCPFVRSPASSSCPSTPTACPSCPGTPGSSACRCPSGQISWKLPRSAPCSDSCTLPWTPGEETRIVMEQQYIVGSLCMYSDTICSMWTVEGKPNKYLVWKQIYLEKWRYGERKSWKYAADL